jgi:hypothetical protein
VILLYSMLWVGFIIGTLALGAFLLIAAARVVFGLLPHPTSYDTSRAVALLVAVSVFGFAYGTWMWFGFEPDDHSRGIAAAPPLAFGVLGGVAATSIAVASQVARRQRHAP